MSFSVDNFNHIPSHTAGRVTNIPQSMVADQFGMVGLLTLFGSALEDSGGLIALAAGMDLTTLGLNLNSPEYAAYIQLYVYTVRNV